MIFNFIIYKNIKCLPVNNNNDNETYIDIYLLLLDYHYVFI